MGKINILVCISIIVHVSLSFLSANEDTTLNILHSRHLSLSSCHSETDNYPKKRLKSALSWDKHRTGGAAEVSNVKNSRDVEIWFGKCKANVASMFWADQDFFSHYSHLQRLVI